MTKETTQEMQPQGNSSNRPEFVVKQRKGYGKNVSYERLGVAWKNEDGSFYVKLYGTQIIEGGFTLYKITDGDNA